MTSKPLTDRTIAVYGASFGAWVYGWLAAADWLISSGLLARAAGVETALPKVSLLSWTFSKYLSAIPTKFFVNGPLGVAAVAVIAAATGWVCWRVGRKLNIDKEAHACESVWWATRAIFSVSFGLLMLTYACMIAAVIFLKEFTGWSYWKFIAGVAAIIVISVPLQLCQPRAVGGETLGPWWGWAQPSKDVALLLPMIVGAWVVFTALRPDYTWAAFPAWIISTVFYCAVATLLIRRTAPYAGSWRLVRHVWEWRRLSAWLLQDGIIFCVAIGVVAPFLGSMYLNTYAMPAIIQALSAQGLERPQWLSFYLSLSRTTSDYWYVTSVLIAFGPVYAWLSLCAGRLAYLQSGHAHAPSN